MAAKRQRQSATEVQVLAESSYTRIRQAIRNLEWSLKRAFYLVISLMQDFYTEPRTVSFSRGSEMGWVDVGNTRGVLTESVTPPKKENESDKEYHERVRENRDYQQMLEVLGEVDRIYEDFDIEIQTNSTLPTDQQSRANLMLQLAQTQITPQSVVDDKAVLDTLRIPEADEILKRKQAMMKAMAAQSQRRQ
jgi:hypothetical protein